MVAISHLSLCRTTQKKLNAWTAWVTNHLVLVTQELLNGRNCLVQPLLFIASVRAANILNNARVLIGSL